MADKVCERQTSFSEVPPRPAPGSDLAHGLGFRGGNQESALSVMSSEVCRLLGSVTERKQNVFNCLFDKYD